MRGSIIVLGLFGLTAFLGSCGGTGGRPDGGGGTGGRVGTGGTMGTGGSAGGQSGAGGGGGPSPRPDAAVDLISSDASDSAIEAQGSDASDAESDGTAHDVPVVDGPAPDVTPDAGSDGAPVDVPAADGSTPGPVCTSWGWTIEPIFFGANQTFAPLDARDADLALDAAGGLHLVARTVVSGGNAAAYTRRPFGGTWAVPVSLPSGGGSAIPLIAVESTGRVHVAWTGSGAGAGVYYTLLNDDGSWPVPTQAAFTGSTIVPSGLRLSQAEPHIVFLGNGGLDPSGYLHRKNNVWVTVPVDIREGLFSKTAISLAIDPSGTVHLIYPRSDGAVVHSTVSADDTLSTDVISTTAFPVDGSVRIVSDGDGGLHALYSGSSIGVRYAFRGASGWVGETLPQGIAALSLAVDAAKVVHVVMNGPNGILHARRVAGAWTVDDLGAVVPSGRILVGAVEDQFGAVHVVYTGMFDTTTREWDHAQRCPAMDATPPVTVLAADQGKWQERSSVARPPSRSAQQAAAYDSVRQEVVMYGGAFDDNSPTHSVPAGTWTLSSAGGDWVAKTGATQPGARRNHGMTFDAGRARVVLMGDGLDQTNVWEWDGQTWTSRTPVPPSANLAFGMPVQLAYDTTRARVMVLADGLWEWDGVTGIFTRRMDLPLALTVRGQAAFDATTGHVVYFIAGRTWEWDPTTNAFTERTSTTAGLVQPTVGVMASTDAGRISLFDGYRMWEWKRASGVWVVRTAVGTGPTRRAGPAFAYDQMRGTAVLFGGFADTVAPSPFSNPIYRDSTLLFDLDFNATFEWTPPIQAP